MLGLIAAVVLAHGSVIKAVAMIILGLLIGLIGTDGNTGGTRFTFGITELTDGLDVATLAIGIFGIGEIIANLAQPDEERSLVSQRITRLWPTRDDFRRAWPAVLRGTALGSALGVLPGGGATLSAFAAYALEKKVSRYPDQFGRGAVEGVAGPESANNAGAQTSFIPMLTLGIPGNAVMALMIGALTIHGIQPGPQIMAERPNVFWGMIASMWIGNLMLVIINLPLIGMWVQLLKVPYRFLFLSILLFCGIGVYTVNERPRRRDAGGVLRRRRLCVHAARLRAGADDSRLRARAVDGGEPAARAAHLGWRSDDLRQPADQPCDSWSRRRCWCCWSRCRPSAPNARKRSRNEARVDMGRAEEALHQLVGA